MLGLILDGIIDIREIGSVYPLSSAFKGWLSWFTYSPLVI